MLRSLTYQSGVDADKREKETKEYREEGRVTEVRHRQQAYHKPREKANGVRSVTQAALGQIGAGELR